LPHLTTIRLPEPDGIPYWRAVATREDQDGAEPVKRPEGGRAWPAGRSPAGPRRARRRVWRYRHQPDLRVPPGAVGGGRRGGDRARGAGAPVADRLGADADGLGQIHLLRHPRRQQGRGRHAVADGDGAPQLREGAALGDRAWRVGGGAVLRG